MAPDSTEVLAVPADALSEFYDRTEFSADSARVHDAVNIVRRHGKFYPRRWAEQTESVRQVIPCTIVRNGPKLLCIKRSKRGRDDLRLRHTLLFGGHVETEDSAGARKRILNRCAERELREELGLDSAVSHDPIGIVVDLATESSRRHFGVVFECQITESVVSVRKELDNSEFTRSHQDNDYPLVDAREFLRTEFDPWSRLLLSHGKSFFERQRQDEADST